MVVVVKALPSGVLPGAARPKVESWSGLQVLWVVLSAIIGTYSFYPENY
jgi:hypothetical protein